MGGGGGGCVFVRVDMRARQMSQSPINHTQVSQSVSVATQVTPKLMTLDPQATPED